MVEGRVGASDVGDVVTFDSRILADPSDSLTKDSPELREYADKILAIESVGECGSVGSGGGADTSSLPTGLRGMLMALGRLFVVDGDDNGGEKGTGGRGELLCNEVGVFGSEGRLGRCCGGGGSTADLVRSGTAGRALEKRDRPLLGGSAAGTCNMVNTLHPEVNIKGNARRNKGEPCEATKRCDGDSLCKWAVTRPDQNQNRPNQTKLDVPYRTVPGGVETQGRRDGPLLVSSE